MSAFHTHISNIKLFLKELSSEEICIVRENDRIKWTVKTETNQYKQQLFESLKDLDHTSRPFDDESTGSIISFTVTFEASARAYLDIEDFKEKLLIDNEEEVDENYLIFNISDHSESNKIKDNYNTLKSELKYLSQTLAHHYEDSSDVFFFIDLTEKSNKTVRLTCNTSELSKNLNLLDQPLGYNYSTHIGKVDNNIFYRERAVFRTSIFDFFKKKDIDLLDEKKTTEIFLTEINKFNECFSENLEVYSSGYSLEKLKLEYSQEQLKFTEQISKIISDVTTKTMIMPGIMALLRITNGSTPSYLTPIVIIATSSIILASLFSQFGQLKLIEQAQNFSLGTLKKRIESSENKNSDKENVLSNIKGILSDVTLKAKITIWGYMGIIVVLTVIVICGDWNTTNNNDIKPIDSSETISEIFIPEPLDETIMSESPTSEPLPEVLTSKSSPEAPISESPPQAP